MASYVPASLAPGTSDCTWTHRPVFRGPHRPQTGQTGQYGRGNRRGATHRRNTADAEQNVLHPCIAVESGIGQAIPFDLRERPAIYEPQPYQDHGNFSAFLYRRRRVRLICKLFPWDIDIDRTYDNSGWVKCADIWTVLHERLHKPIRYAEWALIARDQNKIKQIEETRRWRLRKKPNDDPRPLRIDYLGSMTLFRGLYRDQAFAKSALMPGKDAATDTYVVQLDSHWPRP